ncbi:MAG: CopG family transcriptional regulator [Acidobacteriaceae bacterium]|nr:CopG family transcriptional regulator [Acidobacteriaceae bacterium]
MIRTQISLSSSEYELVKRQARTLGISIAEVIRRAVRDALPPAEGGAWMRFAGFVQSGDSKASQSIDEIVYGTKD